MSTVSTEKSKRGVASFEFSMSESTRLLIGYVAMLLLASALIDDLGPFGGMGLALLFAAVFYGTSFASFKRKPGASFRHPLQDSTRLYVSIIALLCLCTAFVDALGILRALALAFLYAVGIYAMSFIFCQRKITHSFRAPISEWIRAFASAYLASSVSSGLTTDRGLFGHLGIIAMFFVGTYLMSYIFFSKRGDTAQVEADVGSTSETK